MDKRSKEDKSSKNSNSSSSKEMSDKSKHSSHKSSKGNDKSSRSSRESSDHGSKDSGYSSREQFGHSSKESAEYCTPKPFKSDSGSGGSYYKKVHFDPIHIGPVSTLEEMDIKVLRIQNKKLGERLVERDRIVTSISNKLKELEKRQINNDRTVNVVNRYWNQMNEDLNIILLRSEGLIDIESDNKNEEDETMSFVHQLATWDDGELETNLAERVRMSKQQVVKIVQQIDKYSKRLEELTNAMKMEDKGQMERELKKLQIDIQSENLRLQAINKSLHQKAHSLEVKWREEKERSITRETLYSELARKHEEVCYDYENEKAKSAKLEHHLAEALEGMKLSASIKKEPSDNQDTTVTEYQEPANATTKSDEAIKEIGKWKEVAENRLHELEELTAKCTQQSKEITQLKSDLKQLPESIIVETPEYKSLQSQFSVLYNESIQMKTQLDEYYAMLVDNKNMYLNQIKTLESEDVLAQKKYRNDILTLQDYNSQIKKEYEVLRIEYEQNVVANEQTGPINREMRQLITSLQIHNNQLKTESLRYKRKYKDLRKEHDDLRVKYDELYKTYGWRNLDQTKDQDDLSDLIEEFSSKDSAEREKNREKGGEQDKGRLSPDVLQDRGKSDSSSSSSKHSTPTSSKSLKKTDKIITVSTKDLRNKDLKEQESELVRELRSQLKKSLYDQREMKLLLDMYKTHSKETRDKAQILASEKKLKSEVEELKGVVRKIQESKKEDRKKLAEEDAVRKIKYLEEQVNQYQKQSTTLKQGEEVLINEMEVTGQAFEDMQEQNARLIQQLTQKDEENFKLMTERMKFTLSHKSTTAQNASLVEMKKIMDAQIETMQVKTKKLEDKERLLTNAVAGLEKEVQLRTQAQELYKKKAIEVAQSAADYKLHIEKYHTQLLDAQQIIMDKITEEEEFKYKFNRLHEEILQLKKNEDRMKQMETAGTLESVLSQEIRELREILRCPSCKVEQKDGILTKCFHVFCYKCIKVRYDSRQRKCPKCNAAFGANDYHRIYLSG